jgi:hypothetical protein
MNYPIEPPPMPGASWDSIAGVWRKGAFIVPTTKTTARMPRRGEQVPCSGQDGRIRAMSRHADSNAVKAALRRQNRALTETDKERLELALGMALLDAGIDPLTVQVEAGCADEGWKIEEPKCLTPS